MGTVIAGYVALAALSIIAALILAWGFILPGPDRARRTPPTRKASTLRPLEDRNDPTLPIERNRP